jgi:transcriptional regulator with XRE-family HTH domain
MDVIRYGLGMRALRLRRRLTQAQLAERAKVSRSVVYRIERGRADRVTVHTLIRVGAALDARVDVRLLWHGEGLDRLLDAQHAGLVERLIGLLATNGWSSAAEVTFNLRGERGSIDALAFHPRSRSLLVAEVKSVVPDLQAMLVALDRKGRLGSDIARERGWVASSVSRLLVLPENRTARRRIESHEATFRAALPAGAIAIRRWLKDPHGVCHGILFLSDAPNEGNRRTTPSPGPPMRARQA